VEVVVEVVVEMELARSGIVERVNSGIAKGYTGTINSILDNSSPYLQ